MVRFVLSNAIRQRLAALRIALADALHSGAVPMPAVPAGQDLASSASLDVIAGQYLEQSLLYLARQGVLEPDDASQPQTRV